MNKNTIESFKKADKAAIAAQLGDEVRIFANLATQKLPILFSAFCVVFLTLFRAFLIPC